LGQKINPKEKEKENQNLTQITPLNEKHAIQVFPGKDKMFS